MLYCHEGLIEPYVRDETHSLYHDVMWKYLIQYAWVKKVFLKPFYFFKETKMKAVFVLNLHKFAYTQVDIYSNMLSEQKEWLVNAFMLTLKLVNGVSKSGMLSLYSNTFASHTWMLHKNICLISKY